MARTGLDSKFALVIDRDVELQCYTHEGIVRLFREHDGSLRAAFDSLTLSNGATYSGRTGVDCRGDRFFVSLTRTDRPAKTISTAARRALLETIAAASRVATSRGWLAALDKATRERTTSDTRTALVNERAKLVERLAEIDRILSTP